MQTSTMVVLAALHMGWLKFLAVFLSETDIVFVDSIVNWVVYWRTLTSCGDTLYYS